VQRIYLSRSEKEGDERQQTQQEQVEGRHRKQSTSSLKSKPKNCLSILWALAASTAHYWYWEEDLFASHSRYSIFSLKSSLPRLSDYHRLASHLVTAPNSTSGGHEFESPMRRRREVGALSSVGSAPACYDSSLGSGQGNSHKNKNGRHKLRSGQHTL
jgi:hypothetical protein